MITGCIELINPRCVVTCGMDSKIVFFDLLGDADKPLREIKDKHDQGIKHLRF